MGRGGWDPPGVVEEMEKLRVVRDEGIEESRDGDRMTFGKKQLVEVEERGSVREDGEKGRRLEEENRGEGGKGSEWEWARLIVRR